jgi:NTP pyrophosphatase (non-canonical NTP hydrolase)
MMIAIVSNEQKQLMYMRFRNDIVDRLVRKFPDDISNTTHMVLGIFTEIGELDDAFTNPDGIDWINCTEELGDLIFYIIGYSILRNIPLKVREINKTYTLRNVLKTAKDLADLSKKKLAYDKEYDREKESELVQKLFDQMLNFYDMGHRFNPVDAMDRVYNKLIVRYKNGFTTQAATNRNLEAERAALENSAEKRPCGCNSECQCLVQED